MAARSRNSNVNATACCWNFSLPGQRVKRSEEHTSELQSQSNLVCRLLLEKKKHKSDLKSSREQMAKDLDERTLPLPGLPLRCFDRQPSFNNHHAMGQVLITTSRSNPMRLR